MSEYSESIAFTPMAKGGNLPESLRAMIIDNEGKLDTTLLHRLRPELIDPDYTDSWSQENEFAGGWVQRDDASYIEISVEKSPFLWSSRFSEAFPTVRISMRGGDDYAGTTTHWLYQAGAPRRDMFEGGLDVSHLNLRASVWTKDIFQGTYVGRHLDREDDDYDASIDYDANINKVLKAKSANSALLWNMETYLPISSEQKATIQAHRNYNPNFVPNPNWWLGTK
jgi:hypothetical protein